MKNLHIILLLSVFITMSCTPGRRIQDAYSVEGEYEGIMSIVTHSDDDAPGYATVTAITDDIIAVSLDSPDLELEIDAENLIMNVQEDYIHLTPEQSIMYYGSIKDGVLQITGAYAMGIYDADTDGNGTLDDEVREIVTYMFVGTKIE